MKHVVMEENVINIQPHDYANLGLTIFPDFISEAEEQELLAKIKPLMPEQKRKVPLRNCIRRFGSREPYFDNIVSPVIPSYFLSLCRRLFEANLVVAIPDSITINEYYPGQEISPHIDHVDGGPVITVLSLLAPATMALTKSAQNKTTAQFNVNLPARSIVQMRDEIRYSWLHAILPVPALRYSIVFRDSTQCGKQI